MSHSAAGSSPPSKCSPFKVVTQKISLTPSAYREIFLRHFNKIGLIKKEGNLVDATFLRANSKPHIDPDKNSDIDASLGHKGFGYSGTINMDKKTKLIRKTVITPANILDFKSTEEALVGDEK